MSWILPASIRPWVAITERFHRHHSIPQGVTILRAQRARCLQDPVERKLRRAGSPTARQRKAVIRAALVAAALLLATPATATAAGPDVLVWRTEHGIPHIVADDDAGIGYGYGYVVAQDHDLPARGVLRDGGGRAVALLRPRRQLRLLPQRLAPLEPLERPLLPPAERVGPDRRAREQRPRRSGRSRACASWCAATCAATTAPRRGRRGDRRVATRPAAASRGSSRSPRLRPTGASRRSRRWRAASLAITGIAGAQPPAAGRGGRGRQRRRGRARTPAATRARRHSGSNAIALGRERTQSGAGMVLGNPHLPWRGDGLLYQAHLTIPGRDGRGRRHLRRRPARGDRPHAPPRRGATRPRARSASRRSSCGSRPATRRPTSSTGRRGR